jgi:WD40 repeat protein
MMKVHKIENGALKMEKEIELPCGEVHSITTNQVDKIFLGGVNRIVEQFSFNPEKDEMSKDTFEKKKSFTAMKFQSQVNKVRFSGSQWALGFSNEEHMSLFNTETEKTIKCTPGHSSHSVKSGAVSPNNKYVATTGTDGFVRIYKLSEDLSAATFLAQSKICEKKVNPDCTFNLDINFLEDDNSLVVTGN